MKIQQLYSYVRRAVDDYHMIEEGDKIAIGISGGKDSLTLLYALAGLRRFYPKKFELIAITVDLGFEGFDLTPIKALCEELEVEYHIAKTDIGNIIFEERKEASPCSLCAKMFQLFNLLFSLIIILYELSISSILMFPNSISFLMIFLIFF